MVLLTVGINWFVTSCLVKKFDKTWNMYKNPLGSSKN